MADEQSNSAVINEIASIAIGALIRDPAPWVWHVHGIHVELVRCFGHSASTITVVGASGKPGAVHKCAHPETVGEPRGSPTGTYGSGGSKQWERLK